MQAQQQHCVALALPHHLGRSSPLSQWPEGRSVLWLLACKISLDPPLVGE